MSMRYLAGYISASYNPLKVANAPTIGVATPGSAQVSVAFTAPSNVGGGAITGYTVIVTDSSSGATFSGTGASSPIVVTGLTNGNTYTAKVFATNAYGPSAFSAPSGSFVPLARKLYSWGQNNQGQLGQNIAYTINRSSPVQVGALTTWSNIACGDNHSVATKTDGTLWAWGYNGYGQLGNNTTLMRSSPVQVGALTTWSNIACGDNHSVATKTDGTLWAWGYNGYGQLGNNTTLMRSSPVQVGLLTTWSNIAGGTSFTLATKTDGTLWSWGGNIFGELGQNVATTILRSSPVQVGLLTTWLNIASGNYHTVATKTDGTLWSWGNNQFGQLGQNDRVYRSSPVQVGALTTWLNVSAGIELSLATKTDGTLWSWGANGQGQLGQNDRINRSSPVQIGALTTWSNIAGSSAFTIATKTDGTLWAWGVNTQGQLGQNDTISRSSPVQVGSATTWLNIAAGSSFTLATSS